MIKSFASCCCEEKVDTSLRQAMANCCEIVEMHSEHKSIARQADKLTDCQTVRQSELPQKLFIGSGQTNLSFGKDKATKPKLSQFGLKQSRHIPQ